MCVGCAEADSSPQGRRGGLPSAARTGRRRGDRYGTESGGRPGRDRRAHRHGRLQRTRTCFWRTSRDTGGLGWTLLLVETLWRTLTGFRPCQKRLLQRRQGLRGPAPVLNQVLLRTWCRRTASRPGEKRPRKGRVSAHGKAHCRLVVTATATPKPSTQHPDPSAAASIEARPFTTRKCRWCSAFCSNKVLLSQAIHTFSGIMLL